MKKFICLIPFLLVSFCSLSQFVTLDEIISLRRKTLAESEEFLTAKNWHLIQAIEPRNEILGKASFKNDYLKDKVISFITHHYAKSPNDNSINIEFYETTTYNRFMKRLKDLGYKLNSSKIEDGKILKIYKGNIHFIQVTIGTIETEDLPKTTKYGFLITSNKYNL